MCSNLPVKPGMMGLRSGQKFARTGHVVTICLGTAIKAWGRSLGERGQVECTFDMVIHSVKSWQ